MVQVRNDGEGEKGPRLSMNVAVTGRYVVYHPVGAGVSFSRRIEGESERDRLRGHVEGLLEGGIVLRTAAAGAAPDVLRADAEQVMARWEQLRRQAFDVQPPADLSARIPGERILAAARTLDLTKTDVLILSACVQMPSLPLIEPAKAKLGLPVLSASTATAFTLLGRLDLPTVLPAAGHLLRKDRREVG